MKKFLVKFFVEFFQPYFLSYIHICFEYVCFPSSDDILEDFEMLIEDTLQTVSSVFILFFVADNLTIF